MFALVYYFKNVFFVNCNRRPEIHRLFSFQFGLSKLIRGNELELAVSIGMVLNDNSDMYNLAVELLARKCERLGKW